MNIPNFLVLYGKVFPGSVKDIANLQDFVSRLSVAQTVVGDVGIKTNAYILATVKHEVGDTWLPITERGGVAYCSRYERGLLGATLGNTTAGDGFAYRGRGYCQLTGRNNYRKFGTLLSIELERNPDLALKPDTAFDIMWVGMRDGLFTGKKLTHYITNHTHDYINARRIINGDVAKNGSMIAEYARKIEGVLRQC